MKLSDFISDELIITNAKADSFENGKELLVDLFCKNTNHDPAQIREALIARESLGSTIIAPGIAFPHIREPFLKDFYVVIGCFPDGLTNDQSEIPVNLVILYLVPEGKSNLYLRVMAALTKLIAKPGGVDLFLQQNNTGALLNHIKNNDVQVGDIVTARDIMNTDFTAIPAETTLREAANIFVSQNITDICVTDSDGNFLGTVTTGKLLKVGIPDYLLMMDNLSFLKTFEPFQDLLKNEQSMSVMEILNKETPAFPPETPMIQVAGKLVDGHTEFGVVLDGKKLLGTITRLDFIHKVVRV